MTSGRGKYLVLLWPAFALAVVALPTLAVVNCLAIVEEVREPDSLPFEQSTRHNEPHSSDIRYRMAKDLVASKALLGKSQGDIFELLGEPDSEPGGRFQYGLGGPISSFGAFQNILAIEFEAGLAVKAFIFDD